MLLCQTQYIYIQYIFIHYNVLKGPVRSWPNYPIACVRENAFFGRLLVFARHAFEQSFLHADGFNRFCTREYLMNAILCIYIYIFFQNIVYMFFNLMNTIL